MDINPNAKTIKELLLSGRKFVIPRFQREYCWDKRISKTFFNDILKQVIISNQEIKTQSYFLGTMLFIGDYLNEANRRAIEEIEETNRKANL